MNALPIRNPTPERPKVTIPDSWGSVATVVNHLQTNAQATLLTIAGENFAEILLDFSSNKFHSHTPLASLPQTPQRLSFLTKTVDPQNPPEPWLAWENADGLLWTIGALAFKDEPAPWLSPGAGYVLEIWPNLAHIGQTTDELRIITALAANLLTIEQIQNRCGVSFQVSARTVSKLSLLGVLKSAPGLPDSKATLPSLDTNAYTASPAESFIPLESETYSSEVEPTPASKPHVELNSPEVFSPPEGPPVLAEEEFTPQVIEAEASDLSVLDSHPSAQNEVKSDEQSDEDSELTAVHIYPAFDLNAPPPPILVKKQGPTDPSLRIEESFTSILKSESSEAKPEDEAHEEKRKNNFFKRLRSKE